MRDIRPLELLKRLDAQLAALDKIVKGGDYIGAGLDVTLTVRGQADADEIEDDGIHDRSPASVSLEVSNDLPDLMAILRKGLVAARDEARAAAEADRNELAAFLATQEPKV